MIVAIDGPAGAGKSTTARAVAERLGYAYIDTGAMYRAVALAASEAGLSVDANAVAIVTLAKDADLVFRENGRRLFLGEREVTTAIRQPEISELAAAISALAPLREVMVAQQRRLAREGERAYGGAVLEGRDIQTVVFPEAEVKVFLVADPATRATRRLAQWGREADDDTVADITREISDRDKRDSARQASPLRPADDAVHISTDSLSTSEIVDQIAKQVEARGGEVRA